MALVDNLAARLEAIRKQRGVSMAKFSEELGIARSSLQSIFSRSSSPRVDTVEYMADRLGEDPIVLLSAPEDMQTDQLAQKLAELLCQAARLLPEQREQLLEHLTQITDLLGGAAQAGRKR